MNRPLSNAETTFMPELYPATVPLRVALLCAYDGIPLTAVPQPSVEWNGRRYHPGCEVSQQLRDAPVPSEHRGTSDPR